MSSFVPSVKPIIPASRHAWCFVFVDGKLLIPDEEGADLEPEPPEFFEAFAPMRHYLGRLDDIDCWAMKLDVVPPGKRTQPLRAALMHLPQSLASAAGRATQVLEWDRTHRFCGVCATPTVLHPDERARRCPNCGQVAYPRMNPSMMTLVWRGRELLLARSPHFAPGMFSALAGFVEAGESIENCVLREVAEEVGVQVKNVRFYGSQSWPFPNSLMIAYTAEWAGGEIVPQPIEIEAAGWFSIDALPIIPPRFSIAGHLIRDTVEALRTGTEFPLLGPTL